MRYDLPLADDASRVFIGLMLDARDDGRVYVSPSALAVPLYEDEFKFPQYCHFSSYIPLHQKRAVVLGVASRVVAYTLPSSNRGVVFQRFVAFLSQQAHFPTNLIRKWVSARKVSSVLLEIA